MFSFPGRQGSRTTAGWYPDGASNAQQLDFLEAYTWPLRNVRKNFKCRRPTPATSSSTPFTSSSASSSSSYSSDNQLPLKDNWLIGKRSSLRISHVQVPPVSRHRRKPQTEPCSSSYASNGQGIDNVNDDKTVSLTRLFSLWPLQILDRDAPPSSDVDDLLLARWRHQVTATSSRSSVKDGIKHRARKRNCDTKFKRNCLLRRIAPRKTSTVDPMLMMVGIGRK